MRAVLDSSAVLAILFREIGQDAVRDALRAGAVISAVNVAEVVTRLVAAGVAADNAATAVLGLPISVYDLDQEDAVAVGVMSAHTRPFGLSLGDRACLALAKREGLPALTADRAWEQAGPLVGVEVRLIR